jgi:hypothetical protein
VKGRNKRSEKTLLFYQLMGDKRCCPECETLLCSICRHTLARGFGPGVGEASNMVSRERQMRPRTLFQHLSQERVERGAASRVRRVCRVSHVYMVSGLRPSRQQTRVLRVSDMSDGGLAASVGHGRRVCCLRRKNAEFQRSRHVAR